MWCHFGEGGVNLFMCQSTWPASKHVADYLKQVTHKCQKQVRMCPMWILYLHKLPVSNLRINLHYVQGPLLLKIFRTAHTLGSRQLNHISVKHKYIISSQNYKKPMHIDLKIRLPFLFPVTPFASNKISFALPTRALPRVDLILGWYFWTLPSSSSAGTNSSLFSVWFCITSTSLHLHKSSKFQKTLKTTSWIMWNFATKAF